MDRSILAVFNYAEAGAMVASALGTKYATDHVNTGKAALEWLRRQDYAVVVANDTLPDMTGEELSAQARGIRPLARVIITTTRESMESAINLLGPAEHTYLEKPLSEARIRHAVECAVQRIGMYEEIAALKARLHEQDHTGALLGASVAIAHVRERIRFVAASDAAVLVSGEGGTGRRAVARQIHRSSARSHGHLLVVDCETTPPDVLAQELFGVARDVDSTTVEVQGKFELARGGTLVVSDIGYMDASLQSRLHAALEGHGHDVRVVATTRHDLREKAREGRFDEGLLHAIGVLGVELPALRDRRTDIPVLAAHFVRAAAASAGRPPVTFEGSAMDRLCEAAWKGNVRELHNVVGHAALVCHDGVIRADDLRVPTFSARQAVERVFRFGSVREMEKLMILNRLEENEQNRTRSAESLQISVRTLRNKLHEYNVPHRMAAGAR